MEDNSTMYDQAMLWFKEGFTGDEVATQLESYFGVEPHVASQVVQEAEEELADRKRDGGLEIEDTDDEKREGRPDRNLQEAPSQEVVRPDTREPFFDERDGSPSSVFSLGYNTSKPVEL